MNISFCWLDYKEKTEKSQFYEFNRFMAENYGGQKVSMAVNRIPGEKMYIDWVGDQPELLTDTETGEIKKVHIFATTLGVSSLIYQKLFQMEAPMFYRRLCPCCFIFVHRNTLCPITCELLKQRMNLSQSTFHLEDFFKFFHHIQASLQLKIMPDPIHLVEKLKEKICHLKT